MRNFLKAKAKHCDRALTIEINGNVEDKVIEDMNGTEFHLRSLKKIRT